MGTYIGKIDIINSTYFNFTPVYEYKNGKAEPLMDSDIEKLLPESTRHNINFSYDIYNDQEFMDDRFFEDVPVVYEFETDDLQLNIRDGKIQKTGYIIKTRPEVNKEKIKPMSAIGYSLILEEKSIAGNVLSSSVIEVQQKYLDRYTTVFLKGEEGKLIGPYTPTYIKEQDSVIIAIKPEENKFILSGYNRKDCDIVQIETAYGVVTYASPKEGAEQVYIDVIDEESLLESFKQSLKADYIADGKIDLSNIDDAIKAYEKSALTGVDDDIRSDRLIRLAVFFDAASEVDDAFRQISKKLGSAFNDLINKYDDREDADSFINTIIKTTPDILDRIPEYSMAQTRIADLEQQENDLNERITELEDKESAAALEKEEKAINEKIVAAKARLDEVINERERIEKENAEKSEKLDKFETLQQLESYVKKVEEDADFQEKRKANLERQTDDLAGKLQSVTLDMERKISDMSIDGLVANLLVESSSSWRQEKDKEKFSAIANRNADLETVEMTPSELVDYLYNCVKLVRPQYDKNLVINICTCIFQNFLTVFSGEPGSGKTSICNILAQVLGLYKLEAEDPESNRYIPVSVERGWTSKRDFIGYYNPLTKTFDKNNKKVFEALQIADIEAKEGINHLPMLFLLDEANLSPMEYYWADFMNVCDDIKLSNEINIGENYIFKIPETVRFVATINNDHTTETLSPRLVDRAAVITLPNMARSLNAPLNSNEVDPEIVRVVSWESIRKAFIDTTMVGLPQDTKKVYDDLLKHLKLKQITISPRTERSIIRYYDAAGRLFDQNADEMKRSNGRIALDYAVAQKMLPKINGYGEEYGDWLKELQQKCKDNYLMSSSRIVGEILRRGESNMNYFQFFA